MQKQYRKTDWWSHDFAISIASAIIVGGLPYTSAHGADELPGHVCTATMRLQNGGTVYFTKEFINYAQKMDLNDGAGKHIVLASNDLTKRKVLIRNGNTILLDSNPDPETIIEREFGAVKDKKSRPENLMCSEKLFPTAYFDIK